MANDHAQVSPLCGGTQGRAADTHIRLYCKWTACWKIVLHVLCSYNRHLMWALVEGMTCNSLSQTHRHTHTTILSTQFPTILAGQHAVYLYMNMGEWNISFYKAMNNTYTTCNSHWLRTYVRMYVFVGMNTIQTWHSMHRVMLQSSDIYKRCSPVRLHHTTMSSTWLQSLSPMFAWLQSSNDSSCPVQLTSSNQMLPWPLRETPPE